MLFGIKQRILLSVIMQKLEEVPSSEICQTQKNKQITIVLIYRTPPPKKKKTHIELLESENEIVMGRGGEGGDLKTDQSEDMKSVVNMAEK